MNFGTNIQYLRMIHKNMTQEELANRLGVSRQTISKWELNQGNPELSKIKEICTLFNCNSNDLLFGNIKIVNQAFSEIRIENLEAFEYIKYTVISTKPEDDAINRIMQLAKELKIDCPKVIGWDFPYLSQEQINVYHMHGYTSALVLPNGVILNNNSLVAEGREPQNYVTVTIKNPMENPFHLISNAYKSVFQYINVWFQRKDENNIKRRATFLNSVWWWWVRTPGKNNRVAVYIHGDGNIGIQGNGVSKRNTNVIHPLANDNRGGVRPALWIKK